jgi:hypothetical protein
MTVTAETYLATLMIAHGTSEEATRDTIAIVAFDESEAIEKAREWAKTRAVDCDVLQIVKNECVIKCFPLKLDV